MRKAQAAMEFLMTYGWAILVVLAAIGALAYFGVLSPDRFLPSKCTIQGAFSCDDWKADGVNNQVRFKVINTIGTDVSDVNVTITTPDCTGAEGSVYMLGQVRNRESAQIQFNCSNTLEGVVDGDVVVSYRQAGKDEIHTASGTLTLKVES